MSNSARVADTRKVYRLGADLAGTRLRILTLRSLARQVWRELARVDPAPAVVSWPGSASWYDPAKHRIELARNHQTRVMLLHELTHALGHDDHGRRFQSCFADLLARYL